MLLYLLCFYFLPSSQFLAIGKKIKILQDTTCTQSKTSFVLGATQSIIINIIIKCIYILVPILMITTIALQVYLCTRKPTYTRACRMYVFLTSDAITPPPLALH